MEYRYTAIPDLKNINGQVTKRPIVEIELSKGKHVRTFFALIDSGADQITMPAYIAEIFGIERTASVARRMMGISMDPIESFVTEFRRI